MGMVQKRPHPIAAGSVRKLERNRRFLQRADQRPARTFPSSPAHYMLTYQALHDPVLLAVL